MKVDIYLWLIIGLMLLFYSAGLNTTAGYVIGKLDVLNPEGIGLTNFMALITAVFVLAAATGVIIGFFTKSAPESFLLASYATVLTLFMADFVFIITDAQAKYCSVETLSSCWISWIISLIMIPLAIVFAHSIVSWWGGKG